MSKLPKPEALKELVPADTLELGTTKGSWTCKKLDHHDDTPKFESATGEEIEWGKKVKYDHESIQIKDADSLTLAFEDENVDSTKLAKFIVAYLNKALTTELKNASRLVDQDRHGYERVKTDPIVAKRKELEAAAKDGDEDAFKRISQELFDLVATK